MLSAILLMLLILLSLEAVVQRCSVKKVFLEVWNTSGGCFCLSLVLDIKVF